MTTRKLLKRILHSYFPGFSGWFTYYGTRVYFPKGAWVFEVVCEQGIYESDLLKLIGGLISPGSWYFDIGANIGLMSVPILKMVPECHVLSLEPSPNSSPFIKRTREESPWKERWLIKCKAAAEKSGQVEFSVGPSRLAGFDGMRHTGRVPSLAKSLVDVTTLDEEWIALGRPPVSFIKLDIEGAELKALAGAGELMKTARPYVVLEWYHENFRAYGLEAADLLTTAANLGYDVIAVPSMSPVGTPRMMLAQLQMTTSFMLMPR
jgi:FkbM family methyltransferase